MIGRRFAASLRRQDWVAIVIELVVVVVGVFIGLQASNWNEDRQTDVKAAVFTQRLRADLREEAWGMEYQIEYLNEVLVSAKRAADALSGKKPLSDEALLIAAYRATQSISPVRRRATYDELTSAGEIGLVRDPVLRDLSMRVYTDPVFAEIRAMGVRNPYRDAFRRAIAYDVQQTLAVACGDRPVRPGDYKVIEHSLDYSCSTGLSAQVIAANAGSLRNDPHMLPLLRQNIADDETNRQQLIGYAYSKRIRDELQRLERKKP